MYSLVVFLNDVPRGGETIFPRAGYKVAPRKAALPRPSPAPV
jgi:hypothetical protein